MVTISLTTFTDFVAATGTARLTKVRNAKRFYEAGYAPQRDYYKPLKDRIVDSFADGWDRTLLARLLEEVDDPKKLANYEACRLGLTRWAGRKTFTPLSARTARWQSGDLRVGVNPELWVAIGGGPHAIKLHLKADELSQQKANLVLHLMKKCVGGRAEVGILDVRRSKLFTQTREIAGLDALLASEALAFTTLWESL
jgi:hypothetical protein